ncbi:MAG: DMT family transporter [bacterium]|nr:DMT family transporter [bacterium]
MTNKNWKVATILALSTAVISGVSNFINKISVTTINNPLFFTVLKNTLVAAALIGIILLFKKWRELAGLNKKQWLRLILVGVVGGSLPFALFFSGLAQTSAISAALIHKTLFFWVLLLAVPLLKERLTLPQIFGVAAIFLANILVGGFKGFAFNVGELMIFAATLLWAVEQIIAKRALADVSSLTLAGARMAIGSIVLMPFAAFSGGSFSAVTSLSSTQWFWIIIPCLLLVAYVLTWYAALKLAPAIYVAALLVPATLITKVLSAIFITPCVSGLQSSSAGWVT